MRVLVLGGAGAVCKETTRDLAQFSEFEQIVVADADIGAVEALLKDIDDPRLKPLAFDAEDYQGMLKLFPDYDVVANGLPFKFDLPVNQAWVEVGVNGLDLSSDDPQFELHGQALTKDMVFIPGVGATPGITNMMVARAAALLDRMDEVEIYFAAFRCLAPAPGLLSTTLWEFVPEEVEREEVYFEDGAWHPTPPLSGGVAVRFHDQIGEQTVYYVPHDESQTLPRSYPSLRRAAVRGCFPPHVMDLMSGLMHGGFLSSRVIKLNGREMPAVEAVRALLWDNPVSRQNPVWAYGLVVEVLGKRGGRTIRCTYRSKHPPQEGWGGEAAAGVPPEGQRQRRGAGRKTGAPSASSATQTM